MAYTPTVWADGVTPVNATNLNKLEQGLAAAVGVPADVVVTPATAHLIRNRYSAGDTQPSFRLLADGKMEFGPGGSTAPDVSIHRSGAALQVEGSFYVNGALIWTNALTDLEREPGSRAVEIYGAADTGASRMEIWGDGKIQWGPGVTTPMDTNLYRYAAGMLATDGQFYLRGASSYLAFFRSTDANARFYIGPDGNHNWGPGSVTQDTNLYRSGAGYLKTDGQLQVTGNIYPGASIVNNQQSLYSFVFSAEELGASGPRITIQNSGHIFWGPGAGATDTNLYRVGVGNLRTDGILQSGGAFTAGGTIGAQPTGAGAVAFSTAGTVPPATGYYLTFQGLGDTAWRFLMHGDGSMTWGSGAAAGDTRLYRSAAGVLATDGVLSLAGAASFISVRALNPATGALIVARGVGDTQDRFQVFGHGVMWWGPGNAGQDTTLYRSGPNQLKTDGEFIVGGDISSHRGAAGQIVLSESVGKPMIWFGTALDTDLFRTAAGVLRTSNQFWAGHDVYAHYGLSTQVRIGNSSSLPSVAFGSTLDTVISRYAAGVIAVNGEPIRRSVCGIISGAGVTQSGGGFTCVRTGTGQYTVTFNTPFGFSPAVVVNAIMNGMIFCTPASINGSNFTVIIRGTGGGVEDRDFAFIASI